MNKTKIKLVKLPDEFEIHIADREMTWRQAMDYAESINMRLPTKLELQVIAASTDEFNLLGWCWSSSSPSYVTTIACSVYLNYGYTNYFNKTNSFSVLCIKEIK